jgi:hypothetical protein
MLSLMRLKKMIKEIEGNCYCLNVIEAEVVVINGENIHIICRGKNPKVLLKKKKKVEDLVKEASIIFERGDN